MFKSISVALALVLLAGCSGSNPFEDDQGDGSQQPTQPVVEDDPDTPEDESTSDFVDTGGIGPLPGQIANNLTNVTLSADRQSIVVRGLPLDTTPVNATYARDPRLDTNGYTAYSVQEDGLDRFAIALVRESVDGSVEGGVVLDGGQFNRFLGGAFYRRNGDYSPHVPDQPDRGLVSYNGAYVGLSNLATTDGAELIAVDPGTPGAVIPDQAARVTGEVFLNADFSNNAINGAIYDREMTDLVDPRTNLPLQLDPVFLIFTAIEDDGSFTGIVEDPELSAIGTFGGVFGGLGATAVAGAIEIEDYIEIAENEREFGTFVASQCDLPGSGDLCVQALP